MPPKKEFAKAKLPNADELAELVSRAENGDTGVLPELRAFLNDHPEVWQRVGDLAAHAREAQMDLAAGDNLLLRESLTRKLAELRNAISVPSATLLEELLVERVLITWLQVATADAQLAQTRDEEISVTQARFLQGRADQCSRRFLHASKQLVIIRGILRKDSAGTAEHSRS